MKKLLTLIVAIVALVQASDAKASGLLNLNTFVISKPLFSDFVGGTQFSGNSSFKVEVLSGLSNETVTTSSGPISVTWSGGLFFGPNSLAISGISGGQAARLIIRVFNGSDFASSTVRGESQMFSTVLATGPSVGNTMAAGNDTVFGTGFQSFVVANVAVVPEPSTIALGLIGGMAMLARRRRQ